MNIYVCSPAFSADALKLFDSRHHVDVRTAPELPDERELCELIKKYDILVVTLKMKVSKAVYEAAAGQKKVIATLSLGTDHIAKEFFDDPNMTVIRGERANAVSTAEHTMALVFALAKMLVPSMKAMAADDRRIFHPMELCGKTLGVIGAGKIGSIVMDMAEKFGMKVVCNTVHPEKHADLGVKFVSLPELLASSDVVSVHTPLTETTHGLLNAENLALLKPGAILVNASRMGVTDKQALIDLVKQNKIAGLGLDIDYVERDIVDALKEYDNVIMTPHIACMTTEALNNMDIEVTQFLLKAIN